MWMKDVCRHFWAWHVSFIMTTTQGKQQNLGLTWASWAVSPDCLETFLGPVWLCVSLLFVLGGATWREEEMFKAATLKRTLDTRDLFSYGEARIWMV